MEQKTKKQGISKKKIVVFGVLAAILMPTTVLHILVLIYHAGITNYAFKNDLGNEIQQYRYSILCFVEDTQTDLGLGDDGYYYKFIGATNGEMYMLKSKDANLDLSYFNIDNPGDSIHYYISNRIVKEDFSNRVTSEMIDKYPEYLRQFEDNMFYVVNMDEDTKEAEAKELNRLKYKKAVLTILTSRQSIGFAVAKFLLFGCFTAMFIVNLTKYNKAKKQNIDSGKE